MMKVINILVLHAVLNVLVHHREHAHSKGFTQNRKYSDPQLLLDLPPHGLDVSHQVVASHK